MQSSPRLPGLSGMSLYVPAPRVRLDRWCEWTGNSWDKIQAVVGRSFRVPDRDENVYTMAATAVFGLILTWNEFLFALLLTGVETRTVPVAMAQTIGGDIGVRWGLLAAIETLFLIPVAIVTFALQHHLLRGVTFGTIKR